MGHFVFLLYSKWRLAKKIVEGLLNTYSTDMYNVHQCTYFNVPQRTPKVLESTTSTLTRLEPATAARVGELHRGRAGP